MDDDTQSLIPVTPRRPLDAAIAAWLDAKSKRTNSAKTRQAYAETLAQFREVLRSLGLDLLSDPASVRLVAQGWASMRSSTSTRDGDVSPSTFNQRLAIISSFYAYAIKQDLLPPSAINPIAKVDRRPVQDYAGAMPMEASEVEQHLKAIDRTTLLGKRDYAFLMLAHHTGRRIGELRGMRWGHIRQVGKKVTVHFPYCKGGKSTTNELSPAVKSALFDYLSALYGADLGVLSNSQPIWISLSANAHPEDAQHPISIQAASDLYKRCLGVSKTHISRHTFALQMELQGATISEIGDALLHSDYSTTSGYLKTIRSSHNRFAKRLEQAFGVALEDGED